MAFRCPEFNSTLTNCILAFSVFCKRACLLRKSSLAFCVFSKHVLLFENFLCPGFVSHFSFHWVASLHSHCSLSTLHTMLKSLSWQSVCLQEEEWRGQLGTGGTWCSCGTRLRDPRRGLPPWMLLLPPHTHLSSPLCLKRNKDRCSYITTENTLRTGTQSCHALGSTNASSFAIQLEVAAASLLLQVPDEEKWRGQG